MLRPRSVRGVRPYTPDEVDWRLAEVYGPVPRKPRAAGISELVGTILSQHTSDLNSGRAFQEMWDRFSSWEAVLAAPVDQVASAIRSGGLAQQKAPRIQEVLAEVQRRRGSFDLEFLKELPLSEAKAWLQSLSGVGPKTAAVVLCFALGMPAFPVDTHIHRVSRRLGLIGPKVTADEAHDVLEAVIDPDRVFPLHVYLITHGRRVCKAQRPLCGQCVLAERCPSRDVQERVRRTPPRSGPPRRALAATLHGGRTPTPPRAAP